MVADAKKIAELEKLVAEVDRGGRKVGGVTGGVLNSGGR